MILNKVEFFFGRGEFVSRRIKMVMVKLFYIHSFHIGHFQLGVGHFCPTKSLSDHFFHVRELSWAFECQSPQNLGFFLGQWKTENSLFLWLGWILYNQQFFRIAKNNF